MGLSQRIGLKPVHWTAYVSDINYHHCPTPSSDLYAKLTATDVQRFLADRSIATTWLDPAQLCVVIRHKYGVAKCSRQAYRPSRSWPDARAPETDFTSWIQATSFIAD